MRFILHCSVSLDNYQPLISQKAELNAMGDGGTGEEVMIIKGILLPSPRPPNLLVEAKDKSSSQIVYKEKKKK